MNTRIEYLYRDASNYKQFAVVVLKGAITSAEVQRIAEALDSGEYFIPGQVGLPDLQNRMAGFPNPETDHVWHELDVWQGITLIDHPPTVDVNVHRFAELFTGQWDVAAAMKRLGLPIPENDSE